MHGMCCTRTLQVVLTSERLLLYRKSCISRPSGSMGKEASTGESQETSRSNCRKGEDVIP